MRLLTATFTIKPMAFSQEGTAAATSEKTADKGRDSDRLNRRRKFRTDDVVTILTLIVPKFEKIFLEFERLLGAVQIISSGVLGPAFRSKAFPDNLTSSTLELLLEMSGLVHARKLWKKDVSEAFNHPRFFFSSIAVVKGYWLRLIRQWAAGDKDRLPELLLRLSQPTTAGIVFGVGATSARLDADRKAQLNLRRIAFLLLASDQDAFVESLAGVVEKLEELLTAKPTTSPSSATRADVYLVLRALVLKTASVHLFPLWSMMSAELQAALASVAASERSDTYSDVAVLHACKLLDTLLVVAPEEFQLQEWLFITDSIDAVYRPPSPKKPTALVDELSEALGSTSYGALLTPRGMGGGGGDAPQHMGPLRKPLLRADTVHAADMEDVRGRILKPFFSQLSIYAFESRYSIGMPDLGACREELLADIFDEKTIVGE